MNINIDVVVYVCVCVCSGKVVLIAPLSTSQLVNIISATIVSISSKLKP